MRADDMPLLAHVMYKHAVITDYVATNLPLAVAGFAVIR